MDAIHDLSEVRPLLLTLKEVEAKPMFIDAANSAEATR